MDELGPILQRAAAGTFPPVDGGLTVLAPEAGAPHAVLAFTGHAIVVTDRGADELRRRGADGFGGAHAPRLMSWLAGAQGWVGTLDCLLVRRGTRRGPGSLGRRTDVDDHPRVRLARSLRGRVDVHGDERGLVTLGRGLGGRLELGLELEEDLRGRRAGRSLLDDALALMEPAESVFAAVSPGNARSLRVFLAAGFVPIASEQLFRPGGHRDAVVRG